MPRGQSWLSGPAAIPSGQRMAVGIAAVRGFDIFPLHGAKNTTNAKSAERLTIKILIDSLPYIGAEDQVKILDDLKKKSVIGGFKKQTDFFVILKPSKSLLLDELEGQKKKTEISKPLVAQSKAKLAPLPIKDIRADKDNYFLEINGCERFVSFRSKKKIKKLEPEEYLTQEEKEHLKREALKTKQWKILYHLWDFRWEMKNNKVMRRGDIATLGNLKRTTGCKTTGAIQQHIKRLNNRFKKEGLSIEIVGENEKYRLVINRV